MLEEITGPVIAVGHSYGGAVITNVAPASRNLFGLVFVATFALEEGERLGEVAASSRDSVLMSAIVPHHFVVPNGDHQTLKVTIHPDRFRGAFAADLPSDQTAVMAVTQRAVGQPAFSDPSRPRAQVSPLPPKRLQERAGAVRGRGPGASRRASGKPSRRYRGPSRWPPGRRLA